jgi:hypothetical protein
MFVHIHKNHLIFLGIFFYNIHITRHHIIWSDKIFHNMIMETIVKNIIFYISCFTYINMSILARPDFNPSQPKVHMYVAPNNQLFPVSLFRATIICSV